VKEREIGGERANQADSATPTERIVGGHEVAIARIVLLHRGAQQRARRRERHAHRAGEQAQWQRQHRPVLHRHPAVEHRTADEGLGHREWIAFADERRHQALDEATDDERGPRRAEAGAAERPAGPTAPPLAYQLTHQRIGSAVSRPEKDRLPGYRQAAHGFIERRDLVGTLHRWNGEAATDHLGVVSVHRYAISLRYTRERRPRPDMASAVRRSGS